MVYEECSSASGQREFVASVSARSPDRAGNAETHAGRPPSSRSISPRSRGGSQMSKELVISANRHETRVAILEDDQVVEVYHQRENEYSLAGQHS